MCLHKYKYSNTFTQIQILKHNYTNTNTQTQLNKYKYSNTFTQIQIGLGKVPDGQCAGLLFILSFPSINSALASASSLICITLFFHLQSLEVL